VDTAIRIGVGSFFHLLHSHMSHVRFRPVNRCAFCHNKANSKEHAWPEWVLAKFHTSSQRLLGQVDGEPAYFDQSQRALKVRCVCVDCNTRWMSGLEDTVKPIASPLMDDIASKLDILQQWNIALWATKLAMVFEFVSRSKNLYYTDDDRRILRESQSGESSMCWSVGGSTGSGGISAT
jgi:hypothetical protein